MATGAAYIGAKVALAGLSLQFISYGIFCVLLVKTHLSIKSSGAFSTYESCRVIIRVLYFSSVFIFVRPPLPWPRSLPLIPPVDSFYLSCRGIFSGTYRLPLHSRRQVPAGSEVFQHHDSLQEIQSSSTPWTYYPCSSRSSSTFPGGQPSISSSISPKIWRWMWHPVFDFVILTGIT